MEMTESGVLWVRKVGREKEKRLRMKTLKDTGECLIKAVKTAERKTVIVKKRLVHLRLLYRAGWLKNRKMEDEVKRFDRQQAIKLSVLHNHVQPRRWITSKILCY